MAGRMFGRGRISETEELGEAGKTEGGTAQGRKTPADAEKTEMLIQKNRKIWDEESLRLQSEAIRKAGFVILEEVIYVHTDEVIVL